MKLKNEAGQEIDINLWTKFWYVTILPGGIGALILLVSLFALLLDANITSVVVATLGLTLIAIQATALAYWYFTRGKKKDAAQFIVIMVGGEMIGFREPGRFMCPILGELLATIELEVPQTVQGIYGERGVGLEKGGEVGTRLGTVEYFQMQEKNIVGEKFIFDDPRNVNEDEAKPEVAIDYKVINPIKILRLKAMAKKGEEGKSGVAIAIGRMAEHVRAGFQTAVAGKSAAWAVFHLDTIAKSVKKATSRQVEHYGLLIENHVEPTVSDVGETAEMKAGLKKIRDAKIDGDARITKAAQDAKEAEEKAKVIKTTATAEAEARERKAQALEKEMKAEIGPMKDAEMTPDQIAQIMEQRAVKSGLPILPAGVRDVIYGDFPELWRDTGGGNGGTKGKPEGEKKDEKKDGKPEADASKGGKGK